MIWPYMFLHCLQLSDEKMINIPESIQKEHDIKEGQLRREVAALKNSLAELQAANDQLGSVNMELMERLTKEKVGSKFMIEN